MRNAVACLPRYCQFAFVAETATNRWERVEDGCPYLGTESDVQTHEEGCEFRPVRCPHFELEMVERDVPERSPSGVPAELFLLWRDDPL
ncbi:Hypothetical protein KFL_006420080 [Klebsormidium nitens]|uniref:TRAF-type domain-containing protein n=1 Tax=Klebsormidium nitens TaxID=105231 RepID=A0A1Y1IK01_KLENI|nr:Hypothetical protein KFL_006420080 [Klebsormidium nitens]|eukprot:GAQ90462.1 Hypothetical protein KFL_006420080 [Klebsormidium nitens]